jgi:predicted Zn-dependent protease
MRLLTFLTVGLILFSAGCAKAPQEKAIVIVNASAVDAPLLERVRAFAERELHVPVRTLEKPKLAGKADFQTLEKAARRVKTDADVTMIVLSGFNNDSQHLAVYVQSGIAVVNAQALYTDDAEKFARRIERQVMRAAAFCFGLTPTPDPFCVTRDYTSLEDLDSMGRNFSPPWQGRFAEEATRRGLKPMDSFGMKGQAAPPTL